MKCLRDSAVRIAGRSIIFVLSAGLLFSAISTFAGNDGDTPMRYINSQLIAVDIPVGRGEKCERIVGVKIMTEGNSAPLELTSVWFSLSGTTGLSDIAIIKAFYTGANPRLDTGRLFGTTGVSEGQLTISGRQKLAEGVNHLWITADITPEAAEGQYLGGEINTVELSGEEYAVEPATAKSRRLILLENKLLFSGGDLGYGNFRIPAVETAADGSVIIAADARTVPGDLPNDIDIVTRRSTDRGDTWSDPLIIADFGKYGASDPALVLDRRTGDLLCMFASHQGLFRSTPADPIRFNVCRSGDNGKGWSSPTECTGQIYASGWYASWLASGSAFQMRNGRIIGAVGVRQGPGYGISNFMIYSDDSGQSWNYKPAIAATEGDEAKLVELDNGNLMMNIRNQVPDCRKIVQSRDGGESWGTAYFQSELVDPAVNGDLIRYTSVKDGYDKSRLVFSTASDPTLRRNLTLFLSYDEGASWPVARVINPGPSGYSSLTILDDGTIGCFYENGEYEDYQLYFARLSLEWLSGGKDTFRPAGAR